MLIIAAVFVGLLDGDKAAPLVVLYEDSWFRYCNLLLPSRPCVMANVERELVLTVQFQLLDGLVRSRFGLELEW